MKIWLINNYNMLPEHGQLNRNYYFAHNLKKLGHEPVAFVGSHPHNTKLQLITDNSPFKVYQESPFPWVLIKIRNYENNKFSRVLSMFEFYCNMKKAAPHFEKPDAIVGSSAHPLAAVLAIQFGKKYRSKAIVEIRDLWPESIVAYGIAGPKNPIIVALRRLEKWIYTHADAVVFTMEGAYDYIVEQGWEKDIPRDKVHYINNGVDLEQFDYNQMHYKIDDEDLTDPKVFKVVYTGSIRRVNNLGRLLDVAKLVKNDKILFLIWGDGDELGNLRERVKTESISNVIFKGRVDKKYIPYITSQADLNIMHNESSPIMRFGLSANKLFDYFAAGKPILCDFPFKYNLVDKYAAGLKMDDFSLNGIARILEAYAALDKAVYDRLGQNARTAAEEYDYVKLTKNLVAVLEET